MVWVDRAGQLGLDHSRANWKRTCTETDAWRSKCFNVSWWISTSVSIKKHVLSSCMLVLDCRVTELCGSRLQINSEETRWTVFNLPPRPGWEEAARKSSSVFHFPAGRSGSTLVSVHVKAALLMIYSSVDIQPWLRYLFCNSFPEWKLSVQIFRHHQCPQTTGSSVCSS